MASAFYLINDMPSFLKLAGGGCYSALPGGAVIKRRLPTDPIGAFVLTLTNVVVGSAIQIESQIAGTTLYNGTAATSTVTINLSCYAGGGSNDLNNLRIKVRKGSASPYYQPWETLATAIVGSASVYAAQIKDE